jgi:polysaccharide biosynthesis transport protein
LYELTLLLASIRRRRRLAIRLFSVLVVVGAAAVLLLPRTYSTSSQVLVKRPDTALESTTYPEIDALLAWNRETRMETYVALARQPAIAERVIRELDLRTTAKDLLTKNVVVTPLTNSDIIDIDVDWHDALGSAAIANAFARAFIERQRMLAASQASEAAASLSIALKKAQTELSKAEQKLTLFESRRELADASGQTTAILSAIADIQSKERSAEADSAQAQAQLSSIGSQLAAAPRTIDAVKMISSAPAADQIEQQLAQQRLQLGLLRQQFTDRYPDVVATKKQIKSLKSALAALPKTKVLSRSVEPNPLGAALRNQAATLQAQIAGNLAQLQMLQSQEATLLGKLRVFPEDISELSSLQRHAKSAEAIYDALQSNYFNAVVAKSMAVSDLSVVEYADPASSTVRPSRSVALLAVIVVALLATLATVALLEWAAAGSTALGEAP